MIIRFACKCGKPMQAKKEFAGRKMRCPACGAVLTIPSENGESEDKDSAVTQISKSSPETAPAAPRLPPIPPKVTPPKEKEEVVIARNSETAKFVIEETNEKEAIAVSVSTKTVKKKRVVKNRAPANIWVDHSLEQRITPWPEGKKERVGDITKGQRSGGTVALLLVLLLLAGGAVAAFVFKDQLSQLFQASIQEPSITRMIS